MTKTTSLLLSVSIPVTYDDWFYTEEEALDAVAKVAKEAIARACDGREVDISGRHTDCTGPRLLRDEPGRAGGGTTP